jgi:hypothetical protein
MLEECQIHLCLQVTDLEVQEVILAEEQAHSLHPVNGRDLFLELKETRACMDEIKGGRIAKAEQLSQMVMKISSMLFDLGIFPIQEIPQLLKSAQEVLMVVGLLLER